MVRRGRTVSSIWLGVGGTPDSFVRAGTLGLSLLFDITSSVCSTYRTKNALRHEVEKPGISVVTPPNGSFLRQRKATGRPSGEIFVAVSAKRKVSRASSGLGGGFLPSERALKKLRWFRRKRDNAHLDRS